MRNEIRLFVLAMENAMAKSDSEKGESFKKMKNFELTKLLDKYMRRFTQAEEGTDDENKELVNMANVCMMLWNNNRNTKSKSTMYG